MPDHFSVDQDEPSWAFVGDNGTSLRDLRFVERRRRSPAWAAPDLAKTHRHWPPTGAVPPPRRPARTTSDRRDVADLWAGIELREFFLEYQPIVSITTGHLEAFEALLRWQHPVRGVLRPGDFLAAAEASGALSAMTPWIIGEACDAAARWNTGAPNPIAVSVNLTGPELRAPDLAVCVAAAIRRAGISPARLWIEITEDSGATQARRNQHVLSELRELGVRLALDDFGTGCASIGCLRDLPIDAVKIDRSLLQHASRGVSGERILAATAEIIHALGVAAVVEGVETDADRDLAQHHGCSLGQGYLFAPPMSRRAADRLAAAAQLDPRSAPCALGVAG